MIRYLHAAVVLAVLSAALTSGMHAVVALPMAGNHPSGGCHEHRQPAPLSYSCCQAGHDWALSEAASTQRDFSLPLLHQPAAANSATVHISAAVVPTACYTSPPGATSMRV